MCFSTSTRDLEKKERERKGLSRISISRPRRFTRSDCVSTSDSSSEEKRASAKKRRVRSFLFPLLDDDASTFKDEGKCRRRPLLLSRNSFPGSQSFSSTRKQNTRCNESVKTLARRRIERLGVRDQDDQLDRNHFQRREAFFIVLLDTCSYNTRTP